MTRIQQFLSEKPKVVCLGIEVFAEDLKKQGVEIVHVDWRPPAMGDRNLLKILEEIQQR